MTDELLDLDPNLNRCPEQVDSIHLIGICGTAMAALAGMLKERGYCVSGSDAQVYPPMSDFLRQIDIEVHSGYRPENIGADTDLVIVGNVVSRPNPEAQALARLKLPYISLPQALSHFYLEAKRSLVVAGTHGKTTTSAMLASALFAAGSDPGFMIGGILRSFKANYRIGEGDFFICEGDEYDTAFFDKESKFLHYQPNVAIITSLEFDHADIFADLEQIKRSFRKFVKLLPPDGLIIANCEDKNVAEVIAGARCEVQSYGLEAGADWQLMAPSYTNENTSCELHFRGSPFMKLVLRQPGIYNCLNGAAVAAVMHHLGFEPAAIAEGLKTFDGVKRRQEIRGVINGITVIDDFAHHPTAVRETLQGLKRMYDGRRLVAVFEPRTNTSRRSFFQQDYVGAFAAADLSLIRRVSEDKPIDADDCFSSEKLAEDLSRTGQRAAAFDDTDQILEYLGRISRPGDVIAILSNGGFDNIHERLLDRLSRKFSGDDQSR